MRKILNSFLGKDEEQEPKAKPNQLIKVETLFIVRCGKCLALLNIKIDSRNEFLHVAQSCDGCGNFIILKPSSGELVENEE